MLKIMGGFRTTTSFVGRRYISLPKNCDGDFPG